MLYANKFKGLVGTNIMLNISQKQISIETLTLFTQ